MARAFSTLIQHDKWAGEPVDTWSGVMPVSTNEGQQQRPAGTKSTSGAEPRTDLWEAWWAWWGEVPGVSHGPSALTPGPSMDTMDMNAPNDRDTFGFPKSPPHKRSHLIPDRIQRDCEHKRGEKSSKSSRVKDGVSHKLMDCSTLYQTASWTG